MHETTRHVNSLSLGLAWWKVRVMILYDLVPISVRHFIFISFNSSRDARRLFIRRNHLHDIRFGEMLYTLSSSMLLLLLLLLLFLLLQAQ